MMIISVDHFITYLLSIEPEFRDEYESYLKFMDGVVTAHGIASAFSDFVSRKLREGNYSSLQTIFNGVESLLFGNNADESIKNALCTCFLQNLLNRFTEEPGALDQFIHLLGPESIKYCKAWDEFTGVETPGLWGTKNPKFKFRNKLSDEEALEIIKAIKNRKYKNEIEEDVQVRFLEMSIPGISHFLFYDQRNLTPEQILEKAKDKSRADFKT